jgi:cell division transport system permease protein
VETFSVLVHILRLTQWILGGLLLIGIIFITSNTLQLTISSRREEIEVMHWVGASPAYVRVPFYVEGLLQGLLGGALAILFLFLLHQGLFLYIPLSMQAWLAKIPVLFLPPKTIAWILLISGIGRPRDWKKSCSLASQFSGRSNDKPGISPPKNATADTTIDAITRLSMRLR